MKKILTLSFLFLSTLVWAQSKQKNKTDDFYLEYSSSGKTIFLKGAILTVQEWIEQYDNPISSMPGSREEIIKTAILTATDLSTLKSMIRKNGFMALSKNEYGANGTERYYPYTILVNSNGKQKRVEYRSNPDPLTEQVPEAFSEIEKKINELVNGIKEWE